MLHSRYNLNQFEKPKLTETNEGFLQIKGNILKADSFMEYMDKEGVLKEKIPKDILFSEETKNSFLHKKVTLEHPEKNGKLNPEYKIFGADGKLLSEQKYKLNKSIRLFD